MLPVRVPAEIVAKDSAVQVFPDRSQQRISAVPGRRGAVVSEVVIVMGKGQERRMLTNDEEEQVICL